jgi:hypothetical protein
LRHRDGEHYWWIAHGIPGTSMPAFGSRLSDDDIWNVIEYLNAQVEAEEAIAMTDRIKPLRAIVAPDFAFESADRPQESMRQLRGQAAALLVLYTLPQSAPRLQQLAAEARAYARRGARVIVAPFVDDAGADVASRTMSQCALHRRRDGGCSVRALHPPIRARGTGDTRARRIPDRPRRVSARALDRHWRSATTRTVEALDRLAILRR